MGWFGSGLCPTRNQPDGIEFWKNSLVKNSLEKTRDPAKNLIGIYEISLDPAVISSDLMRFRQIQSKSSQTYVKYHLNLGFLAEIWVFFHLILEFFSPEYGFFSGRFRFFGFWGIETEIDPSESVSRGRKPAADRRNSRVNRFQIDSDQVLRVGRVSDGFGQAYM